MCKCVFNYGFLEYNYEVNIFFCFSKFIFILIIFFSREVLVFFLIKDKIKYKIKLYSLGEIN